MEHGTWNMEHISHVGLEYNSEPKVWYSEPKISNFKFQIEND